MSTMDTPSTSKPETVPGALSYPARLREMARLLARHAAQDYLSPVPLARSASSSPRNVEEKNSNVENS